MSLFSVSSTNLDFCSELQLRMICCKRHQKTHHSYSDNKKKNKKKPNIIHTVRAHSLCSQNDDSQYPLDRLDVTCYMIWCS